MTTSRTDSGGPSRHLVSYADGESIFRQGEPGDQMYIIRDGQVEIVLEGAEGAISMAILERGDFFGEMAVLEGAPRTATARAKGACSLLPLRGSLFIEMLQRDPETTLRIMKKLCARIRELQDRLSELAEGEVPLVGEAPPAPAPAPAVSAPTRARLVHEQGAVLELPNVAEIRVGRPDTAVGTVPDVDLTPFNQARTVSRSHAKILQRDGKLFVIAEAGTTNGTFVDAERLEPGVEREARHGDRLTFGTVALKLEIG